jgi:hypothetical protein
VDPACDGNNKPVPDVKVITAQKVSRLYCYATVDQKNIPRIPQGDDSFISPMSLTEMEGWKNKMIPKINLLVGSGFDLSPYLPVITPKGSGTTTIKFECWDWDTQSSLGTAEKSFTDIELGKISIISSPNFSVIGVFGVPADKHQSFFEISPPVKLRTTGDPNLCAQHKYNKDYDYCSEIIRQGGAVFVWEDGQPPAGSNGLCFPGAEQWCTQVADIDGFRLYRFVDQTGTQQVVSTISFKTQETAGFTQWPSDDAICFTVRAYKGSLESADSNVACLNWAQKDTTGTKTATIQPTSMDVHCETKIEGGDIAGGCSAKFNAGEKNKGPLTVGHIEEVVGTPNAPRYYIGSGIVQFKNLAGPNMIVSEVMGKPILSARLKYRMTNFTTWFDYSYSTSFHNNSCDAALGVMNAGYAGGPYSIFKHPIHPLTSDQISVDVTDVVKGWAQGQPNFGFILDGVHYGSSAVAYGDWCQATYDDFKLEVVYFPNK